MLRNTEKLFFDFEFLHTYGEFGSITLQPLSIGVATETTGHEFYAELDYDLDLAAKADPWLISNVIEHMRKPGTKVLSQGQLAQQLTRWVTKITHKPEWWAYRVSSDWCCMMAIYKGYHKLPKCFGKSANDLALLSQSKNFDVLSVKKEGISHNALDDARWNAKLFRRLQQL